MDGQSKSQRVVLIHDASGGVRFKAVRWVLDGFLLKDGDTFTFLSVLHQIQHPMGYKIRVDSSMFGGANQKAIDDEVAKKKKEYDDNLQLLEISKLYNTRKVDFKIELVAGPIPKNAAIDAAKKYNATWVILDRRMKKDKKYFLDKLSCGISTMKHNDDIIDIRGPRRRHQTFVSYGEMLPGDNNKVSAGEATNDPDLFSIEFESSCASSASTRTSFSDMSGNNQDDKMNELSTLREEETENSSRNQVETRQMSEQKVLLDNKKCATCETTVPITEEVNENVEKIGQSQHTVDDEEVNYGFGGMSPMPKQAKHFYQGARV